MKKCLAILLGALLCAPLFSAELTDREMSDIYAGEVNVGINDVSAANSAVAAQSNIGVILAGNDIDTTSVANTNRALVANIVGDAAVAMQSNIGVIVSTGMCQQGSCDADVTDSTVTNHNGALVINVSDDLDEVGVEDTVDGASIDVDVDGNKGSINDTWARYSAVASQSNIGAIVALGGDVRRSHISNTNTAVVGNVPASVAQYLLDL